MKANRKIGVVLVLVLCVSLAMGSVGWCEGEASAAQVTGSGDYLVGAGDLIEVIVWKNPDVSGEYRVRPDGKFSMPLIGDILAEGMTTDVVSMQVEKKLQLFIESPYVSAIVRETTSNRIYILGEVARPGVYPVDSTLSVLQALALAGGFTEFADRGRMLLVRGSGADQQKITISYTEILKSSADKGNVVLERGDTLVVP
ncbi:MAG: polysaccharide biosynthesis/export family protein [bacterium]|nr:polysaccharide biosynthesis/export family protein [bacterium]